MSTDTAILQAIMAAEEHITLLTKERSYYRNICEESKKNMHLLCTADAGSFEPPPPHSMIVPLSNDTTVYYSFDMAQQVIYMIVHIYTSTQNTLILGPLPK